MNTDRYPHSKLEWEAPRHSLGLAPSVARFKAARTAPTLPDQCNDMRAVSGVQEMVPAEKHDVELPGRRRPSAATYVDELACGGWQGTT